MRCSFHTNIQQQQGTLSLLKKKHFTSHSYRWNNFLCIPHCCPMKLWMPHPWKCLRPGATWSSEWCPCPWQGTGMRWGLRFLPTQTILGYSVSHNIVGHFKKPDFFISTCHMFQCLSVRKNKWTTNTFQLATTYSQKYPQRKTLPRICKHENQRFGSTYFLTI